MKVGIYLTYLLDMDVLLLKLPSDYNRFWTKFQKTSNLFSIHLMLYQTSAEVLSCCQPQNVVAG